MYPPNTQFKISMSLHRALALGGLFLVSSCNLGTQQSAGIRMVDDLVSHVETVQIEAQVSAQSVFEALRCLHPIVSGSFQGDATEAYVAFAQAVESSEVQAQSLRGVIDPMKASAERVFARWEANLEQFHGEAMRARSEERLTTAQVSYGAVVDSAEKALADMDQFNAGMRDLVLFLGIDLNPSSIAAIDEDARGLASMGKGLRGTFDACAEAASEYVVHAAPLGQVQVEVRE